MYPYNHKKGQRIQTNADGYAVDRAFGAHIHIPAELAVAADEDGVLIANLDAKAQTITEGITSPAYPRALTVDANVSGVVGNVKITGTNFAGEEITETIALNETTLKDGDLAFKTVTKIELPAQIHTPEKQVETATAVGTVTQAGNAAVTVTSKLFTEAVTVDVPVEGNDDAAAIALAIRTALAADPDISEHFDVSGETAAVILTAKEPAANDTTLNIAIANGTGEGASDGVTTAASSADTTAGVPYDIVYIGWNDKLGLPYKLAHNTVLMTFLDGTKESAAPTVALTTDLEGNTIDLSSALNTKDIDIYLIV